MKELKEDIIEAVQDATDTVDGTVSIPILSRFLDNILTKQLRLHSVVKSFTSDEIVKALKDCDHLDDAIMYFNEQK